MKTHSHLQVSDEGTLQNTKSEYETEYNEKQQQLFSRIQIKQVCPQSRGKRAALLGMLVTPHARPKPARLIRPTHLQF